MNNAEMLSQLDKNILHLNFNVESTAHTADKRSSLVLISFVLSNTLHGFATTATDEVSQFRRMNIHIAMVEYHRCQCIYIHPAARALIKITSIGSVARHVVLIAVIREIVGHGSSDLCAGMS